MKRMYLLLLALSSSTANAQQASAPDPIVRATLAPQRVVVGQKATLKVDVLAPNYMPKPPVLPDFQIHNAVTRAESSVNMTEQHNGNDFAGVRFEFSIYPQEPGSYAIKGQSVTVTYAAEPPASREATVPVAPLAFEAFIPDAAQALDPFVTADTLTARENVQRSSEQLKVGDAVTRTITIEATGTPAMLLPPIVFTPIDGTALYPAQPELQDRSDRRSSALSAARVDQATYMLQRAGDVTLPELDISWWNAHDQKVERIHIDRTVIHVAENPALKTQPSKPPVAQPWRQALLFLLDHWRALLNGAAVLAALAWVTPRIVRTLRQRLAEHRDAYRNSEAFAFSKLRAAARQGEAQKTYFALLGWLTQFDPVAPHRSVAFFRKAASDPALDREIALVEGKLYGPQGSADTWSSRELIRRVDAARRRLSASEKRTEAAHALPDRLNPTEARGAADWRLRPPAR